MSSQWHVDKTVSLGHLISTLIIAISIFAWASLVDRRIDQNMQDIGFLKEQMKAQQVRTDMALSELKVDIRAINNKLDRLIESKYE